MGKRKRTPEDFESICEQFMEQLVKESDRGCVLVAAAMLDEALEFLLRQRMASEEAAAKACVDPLFVGLGPLKSFWAKTQLARALGFIDQWIYEDLERIRTLRNLFAHSYENADFADARVIALTERLVGADKFSPLIKDTPVMKKERARFTFAAAYVGGYIHGRSAAPIRRH
jgi:DNA-binding MltR family transcriptional regulator